MVVIRTGRAQGSVEVLVRFSAMNTSRVAVRKQMMQFTKFYKTKL